MRLFQAPFGLASDKKIINSLHIPERDEKTVKTCGMHYTCLQTYPMIRNERYIAWSLISKLRPQLFP